MKKLVTHTLLSAFLLTSAITPLHAAQKIQLETVSKKTTVENAFKEFKKSVYVDGNDFEIATQLLVDKLIESKATSGELQLYVAKHSTKESYQKFNELMDLALEDVDNLQDLSQEDMSFILKNAMEKTTSTGSNFISCAAGKSIGLPLLAVGVVLGIIALANSTASKELVTQEYLEKKRQKTDDYQNTIADLELEVTTYESDIIYYQDEIDELNRRINSGNYSDTEIEEMYKLIRDYQFFISDSHALIGEVNVDIAYFENEYTSDITTMDLQEASELERVDELKKNSSKQAIAAGIIGGVGAVFGAIGMADCN